MWRQINNVHIHTAFFETSEVGFLLANASHWATRPSQMKMSNTQLSDPYPRARVSQCLSAPRISPESRARPSYVTAEVMTRSAVCCFRIKELLCTYVSEQWRSTLIQTLQNSPFEVVFIHRSSIKRSLNIFWTQHHILNIKSLYISGVWVLRPLTFAVRDFYFVNQETNTF